MVWGKELNHKCWREENLKTLPLNHDVYILNFFDGFKALSKNEQNVNECSLHHSIFKRSLKDLLKDTERKAFPLD